MKSVANADRALLRFRDFAGLSRVVPASVSTDIGDSGGPQHHLPLHGHCAATIISPAVWPHSFNLVHLGERTFGHFVKDTRSICMVLLTVGLLSLVVGLIGIVRGNDAATARLLDGFQTPRELQNSGKGREALAFSNLQGWLSTLQLAKNRYYSVRMVALFGSHRSGLDSLNQLRPVSEQGANLDDSDSRTDLMICESKATTSE